MAPTVDLLTFDELLGPRGQAALAEASALSPRDDSFLSHLQKLQKAYPPELAKAALETALWRARAHDKFTRAGQMYFTREALEQASGEAVSGYRSARYSGFERVADLGCGIGGDALSLAAVTEVTAVDRDGLRLRMARENLRANGRLERAGLVQADVTAPPWPAAPAFFFDPARRAAGRRRFSVLDYQPPLQQVRAWLRQTPAGGVKISPGVDLDELAGYDAEVEFISVQGELKEAVLWFGPLKSAERRATVLPGPHTLLAEGEESLAVGPPQGYLYEPDPAVLRAGLVTTLAARLGARRLDPDIAYLTAPELRPTPFARAFVVDEAMPFQLKRLRERLRALRVGHVTVKKRGSPLEPEQLIQQLRLPRDAPESRVVFLTHVEGEAWVVVARSAG